MKKMMKIFVVFLLFCCLSITASATENNDAPPAERFMCDVDNSGMVEAADARVLLRFSVGLESILSEDIVYGDADFNGKITAADARIALRISVNLDTTGKYAFVIIESKEATCTESGFVKAQCPLTEAEVSIISDARKHNVVNQDYCKGTAECSVCGEKLTVDIRHSFNIDYKNNTRECYLCGKKETYIHHHSFKNSNVCECGDYAIKIFEYELRDYLKKNGEKEDGMYFVTDYKEPMSYALIYDEELGFVNAFCGFAADVDGEIVYYDFYYDLVGTGMECIIYTENEVLAYVAGRIEAQWVDEMMDGNAVIIEEYETVPDGYGYESEFRRMMEGAVYNIVQWLRDYGTEIGFNYMEYVFADFTGVK